MYLVHVLTIHNNTLGIRLVTRCKDIARLHLSTSFVPTLRLGLVVSMTIPSVTLIVTSYALVTFHIERVCTVQ
jgi:hypothetical protein